ncbi:hypothetical protein CAI21_03905 [Alkalilimnicola ehrlichii]|uniref:Rhodanese domain-containing protein n=1 Tax=Alkalilimnicola ehrlichii TaxID=351052 RepID=A0A3E0X1D9_9GAMM|nr:rhodanese-like domain-containing protein [Alkalilimnicola ehrlichii]RFA30670.1 hypothetical protein CAI21_03905 [Alkalilimnicola ehrlichii]RFA38249.1 hypothetical protein CAL65_05275 [Alkalilimnicola ehrlichii]
MEQVIEFIGNNPILTTAFVAILTIIVIVEVRRMRSGGGDVEPGQATELFNKQNALFLDTRDENAFRKAHLPGAINVPGGSIDDRLNKLSRYKNRPVIVYCGTGLQSGRAVTRLRQEGFEQVYKLKGGFAAWQSAGFPLESK